MSIEQELAELAEREKQAEALWAGGKRKFSAGGLYGHVARYEVVVGGKSRLPVSRGLHLCTDKVERVERTPAGDIYHRSSGVRTDQYGRALITNRAERDRAERLLGGPR